MTFDFKRFYQQQISSQPSVVIETQYLRVELRCILVIILQVHFINLDLCARIQMFVIEIISALGPGKEQLTYVFQGEWEENYCFVENKGNGVCLLCNESVTVKKYNIERQFQNIHAALFIQNYLPDTEK